MTALPCRSENLSRETIGLKSRAQLRAEALERLIALLEAAATESPLSRVHVTHVSHDRLNQAARLRAAHAAYALSTGAMQRQGDGAWARRTVN